MKLRYAPNKVKRGLSRPARGAWIEMLLLSLSWEC